MNHPSEWTRYYDAPKGTYRYKHKGTGVVRDTLMAIGRRFKKKATLFFFFFFFFFFLSIGHTLYTGYLFSINK